MAKKDDKSSDTQDIVKKKGKGGLIILFLGILLALGGGAAAGYMGLLQLPFGEQDTAKSLPDISKTIFIPLPKIVIPLGENAQAKYLRARFDIETEKAYAERITTLQPRLMDMLNTYLRAVEEKELSDPGRFQNLQAQMLRRARLVAGEAAIKNLLVQEFILQ